MKTVALAAVLVLAAASGVRALDVDLKAYDAAGRAAATATIAGRVFTERSKPNAPDMPIAHAVVVALPRSEAFLRQLVELRAHARDSVDAYRDTATKMRRARETYEREVWEAGAADLVRTTSVDAKGRFEFADLPAGRWLVWGTHSEFVEARSPKSMARDRDRFRLPPRFVGYYNERAWLREVDTTPGTAATVELTDRNVWFAGVVEDRVLDAGPRR